MINTDHMYLNPTERTSQDRRKRAPGIGAHGGGFRPPPPAESPAERRANSCFDGRAGNGVLPPPMTAEPLKRAAPSLMTVWVFLLGALSAAPPCRADLVESFQDSSGW